VERRKKGIWGYYHLCGAPRSPYAASLLGSLRFWLEGDAEVAEVVRKIPDIRRKNLCGV
jgi:ArsR family transcriptional regulator, arsenate/arsenite/antimonite-responsive transcriptional repressor